MVNCAVLGCGSRSPRDKVRFFSIPAVITNQCKKTEHLSRERRRVWLSRINRADLTDISVKPYTKVCSRHFLTGQPSPLFADTAPDWAPSVNMGYEAKGKPTSETCSGRFERVVKRRRTMSAIENVDNNITPAHLREPLESTREPLEIESEETACATGIIHDSTNAGECPYLWDGELCWPLSPRGKIVTQLCPENASGVQSQAWAECLLNGTWVRLWRGQNESLSINGSLCFSPSDTNMPVIYQVWVPVVRIISQVGYTCSLITLLLAFFVLFSSKKLRCPRNNLHLHLFASFILRASMNLLMGALFVDGLGMAGDIQKIDGKVSFIQGRSNWNCKLVTTIRQYAIMANYSWILAEGLYLHNLIFLALFTDSSSIALYVVLGWGLPAIVVIPWIIGRLLYENTMCWTVNENQSIEYMIKIPTIMTNLLSFGLFINIARVLLSKMLASVQVQRRELQYRRWARSTMVLVPLFGTHYGLLIIFSVPKNDVVHVVWLLLDQTFASFQGALVALLYCLMTQEVRTDLKRRWNAAVTSIGGCRCGKKWCCCYNNKSNGRLLSSCRGGSLLQGNSGGVVACQVRDMDISGGLEKHLDGRIDGRLDGLCPDMNAVPVPVLPTGERPLGPLAPDRCGAHAQSWV